MMTNMVHSTYHKFFMPKYKADFRVFCIQGNKVEVKDNNGKLSWYHISDIKKTDMVTKFICQLPDVDAIGRTAGSVWILTSPRILAGYLMTGHINLIQIMQKIFQIQHGTLPNRDLTKWS